MLKSVKRTFDDLADKPPPCSPLRIQFLDTTPYKRARMEDINTTPTIRPVRKHAREGDSIFTPSSPFQPDVVNKFEPKRKRMKGIQSTEMTDAPCEKMFTLEEVKEIVARVVAERESALRIEYNHALEQRLQEQFAMFSQFNEDNISRQLKQSDFSYMS